MKKIFSTTLGALTIGASTFIAGAAFAGDGHSCEAPVETCLNGMVSKLRSSGFIGVEIDDEKVAGKLVVTSVIEGSPAEQAGIRVGDELYSLNGIRFSKENDAAIRQFKVPGNQVTCTVKRNGANKSFKVTLVPMPADLMAKYIGEHMLEHAAMDAAKKKTAKK